MLLLSCATVRAYDFADTLSSGQVLYYSQVAGGVEVVYPGASASTGWVGYTMPTGALTIPATVSHEGTTYAVVGVGDYAFRFCTGLTSVTLSDGIASVGSSVFYSCTGIVEITLPASVTTVGNGAFSLVASLTDLWMWSAVPPTTSSTAFYAVDLSECTLHVPCGAAAAYGAAPWNSFGTVVEGGCVAYIATAVNDPARGYVTGSGSYVPGEVATLTAIPAERFAFICWNDGDTLNPRPVQVLSDSLFTAMFFALPAPVYVFDTVRDTVTVLDTVMPLCHTLNVLSDNLQLGVGVGSAQLPLGTEVEVCGLPLEGARFVAWSDGATDNPRRVTVTGPLTLSASFAPVPATKASSAERPAWTLAVEGHLVTVGCGVGERLRLYDAQGRCQLSLTTTAECTTLTLPSEGVWLVQVGDGPARKIVITEH